MGRTMTNRQNLRGPITETPMANYLSLHLEFTSAHIRYAEVQV